MGEKTAISWADGTWNPWFGCTKVSVGEKGACTFCYAEQVVTKRLQHDAWGTDKARVRAAPSGWRKPLAWDKDPAKHLWKGEGVPPADWRPFVFCASLADVFDNAVPPEWRRDLFDLIRATPHLTWLLLTKRPGNIVKLFHQTLPDADPGLPGTSLWLKGEWPRNAAIGCTVVTEPEADRDVPVLLLAKQVLNPAFAFVSMEPLMGDVDLTRLSTMRFPGAERLNALTGELSGLFGDPCATRLPPIDWVITGGETDQGGPTARPSHPEWFRSLREQCAGAGVPFHFKQQGEWAPHFNPPGGVLSCDFGRPDDADNIVWRVGKKAPGWNLLDGVLHDARPHVAP